MKIRVEELSRKVVIVSFNESDKLFTITTDEGSEMIVSLAPKDGSFTYRKLPGRKYEYYCGSEMVGVVDIEERNRTLTEGDWW